MSMRCSFVRTPEEVAASKIQDGMYAHRKTISMNWLIDQETYDRLLPPGLEPADRPEVYAFVSAFTHSGFNLPSYNEGGLFLICRHKGLGGALCLSMPIQAEDEMGILNGRERYGYPKKPAKVQLSIVGDRVHAVLGRHGIDYFELNGILGESHEAYKPFPEEYFGKWYHTHVFLLDHKVDDINETLDEFKIRYKDIRMVDQINNETIYSEMPIKAELTFRESPDDPWCELAPKEILSVRFNDNACDMKGCVVLENYDTPEKIAAIEPYLFARYDSSEWGYRHEFWL